MLELTVFLSGALVLILELVASRILAPYVGTSLYVWTSLIGVILGSLSLGYWLGGRLADRSPQPRVLALTLIGAAAAVSLIPIAQGPLLSALATSEGDPRWNSLGAAMLFALPAVLLGVVSPFAARLRMTSVSSSGSTVGKLYAISTLGSIAGAFAAGFWLIPNVGSTRLVYLIGLCLLGCSALNAPLQLNRARLGVLAIWGASVCYFVASPPAWAAGQLLLDRDTAYQRLLVFDLPVPNRQPVRVLAMGFSEYHSAMFLDRPQELALDYTRFFSMVRYLRPSLRRILCVGGGALSFPRYLLATFPEAFVDVVELDPGVSQVAQEYFHFTPDPRLSLHHEDGRVFLNRVGPRYDAVFLDVFWGRTIPQQLATVESARRIAARLAPDGVLLVNFVSGIDGPGGAFFQHEYATLKRIFPHVLVFPVFYPGDATRVQNLVLVAAARPEALTLTAPELRPFLAHLWTSPIPAAFELTDDFAPVEHMAARQLAVGR
ncbi:fused MFS/spermidine synthase [Paludibaculum fermentans]|uniref:fused MFS/spermidine synthase n=1 Tax=Paludibaculum fermentans TaxID=1473598 RepID=UPI003EBAF252